MDQTKFMNFCNSFEDALKNMLNHIPGLEFTPSEAKPMSLGKTLSSIVGVVGLNKGRVHVEMNEDLAKIIYEQINGEPAEDEMDLCFYLAEFTNMITGNGITKLNNTYKGSNLRLTPPAIFVGENLDVKTPQVFSAIKFFSTKYGMIRIEIGFEGV